MKKYILIIVAVGIFSTTQTIAQNLNQKLYTMNGLGFSFPVGETADYLKPKFSTSIGINLATGNKGLFIYPKLSLHAYSYNELQPQENQNYVLQKGRATTYLLNLALGYRKNLGKFSFYVFGGAGGGFILLPKANLTQNNAAITLGNTNKTMFMIETGFGLEYKMGESLLFIEPSYMLGFSKIQNKTFNSAPLTVGLKPNLSKLFNKITRKEN